MGFGGGGGGSVDVVQPPDPGQNTPLQGPLAAAGLNMLTQASPFAHSGAGYQLLPRSPLGQVFMPGPNPTIFGDPFNAAHSQSFFGPNTGAGNGSQQPMQGAPQGGSPQGGSSQAPAAGAGPFPGLPVQGQPMAMGGYAPSMGGQGVHPMTQLLQGLLQPGVLGNLFAQYAQSQGQQPQPTNTQPQQPQQQGGSGGNSSQ